MPELPGHRVERVLQRPRAASSRPADPRPSGRIRPRRWSDTGPPASTGRSWPQPPPAGRGRAVVRRAWPGGSPARRAFARYGSSSEKTSSRSSTGGVPSRSVASWWAASCRARASERCSPWEAWVRPGSPPRRQLQLVPVGADQRDPPLDVLGPGLGQGVEQTARPRALVLERDRRSGAPGQPRVVGRRRWAPAASTRASRASTSAVPAASSRASHTSRVLADLGGRACRPGVRRSADRWRRIFSTSSAARAAFGSTTARVSSRNRRRSAGSGPDHPDVLRGEHRGPEGLVEIARAGGRSGG